MENVLLELNKKKDIFNRIEDINKAVIDIQDSCNIGEHGVAFIIAEYGINMYIKQIHKSIPTTIRTKFIRPPHIYGLSHLKKIYKHYNDKFNNAYETIKQKNIYNCIVDLSEEELDIPYSKVKLYFSYDNTPRPIDIHIIGTKIVSRDQDCRGGFVNYDFGPLFKMCRKSKNDSYHCFCDDDN